MSKTLVVLTPCGPEYEEMAEICTVSLRNVAGYDGPITWFENDSADGTEAMLLRMSIPDSLDLRGYERLWYLDCDIRVVRPWSDIDAYLDDSVYAISEACTTRVADPYTRGCLTMGELLDHGDKRAVNGGVIGINLMSDWCGVWDEWKRLAEDRFETLGGPDESATNAIALRHDFTRIPRAVIHYPANPLSKPHGASLVHYAGMSTVEKLRQMRRDRN